LFSLKFKVVIQIYAQTLLSFLQACNEYLQLSLTADEWKMTFSQYDRYYETINNLLLLSLAFVIYGLG